MLKQTDCSMPPATDGPTVAVVVGTRPEAIKMAPVILALKRVPEIRPVVIATGQHGDMLDVMFDLFGIVPDHHLRLMQHDQTVADVSARCLSVITPLLSQLSPRIVLVQGDTATACFASMAAFMAGTRVGHVEAGLRTSSKWRPFPEELFRRVISTVADLHFAPTGRSRDALIREGRSPSSVTVTGNTVVDAIELIRKSGEMNAPDWLQELGDDRRLVLVTMHRRESFGEPMHNALRAIRHLTEKFRDVAFVFPVHPNPAVRTAVREVLGRSQRVRLIDPVPYPVLLAILSRASCVLTDSGGIQEEAPSFGVPAIVLREETERMEGVEAGVAFCIGTDTARIVETASSLLTRVAQKPSVRCPNNPYGDGHAAQRIVEAIQNWLCDHTPLRAEETAA